MSPLGTFGEVLIPKEEKGGIAEVSLVSWLHDLGVLNMTPAIHSPSSVLIQLGLGEGLLAVRTFLESSSKSTGFPVLK